MAAKKLYGYPKDNGRKLADLAGKVIGEGEIINRTKVRLRERGAWISSERVSYHFKVAGNWYSCRGLGDGLFARCLLMKKPPPGKR